MGLYLVTSMEIEYFKPREKRRTSPPGNPSCFGSAGNQHGARPGEVRFGMLLCMGAAFPPKRFVPNMRLPCRPPSDWPLHFLRIPSPQHHPPPPNPTLIDPSTLFVRRSVHSQPFLLCLARLKSKQRSSQAHMYLR